MGSMIEINDTLQLTTEQGFPFKVLDRTKHCKKPVTLETIAGRLFKFHDKPNPRIFQLDPVRVYLVHNVKEKWLFWGHALIQSLTFEKELDAKGRWKEGQWITSGTYTISEIYDPEYQQEFTLREAPADRNYFR
jgi:hypothetical protein